MNKKLIVLLPLLVIIGLITFVSVTQAVTLPGGEALFSTSLASRISASDTSMTVVRNSAGGTAVSGYHCFTIDEGRSDAEFVCGTISGTSVTGLERGISYTNATSTVASIQHIHRAGANVKITDYPLIQRLRNLLNGQESIPNLIAYLTGTDCTASSPSNSLCSKSYTEGYANNVISGGAPTSTEATGGKVELGTLAEQAASFDGGALKPTVLQTKNATSGCQVIGTYALMASSTTGKLAGACFDQTYRYSFTGTTTLATSTIASTTIQNALNVAGTATFQGTVNGISGKLYLNTSPTIDVMSTASTTIFNYTLPGNTLSTSNIVHMRVNFHGIGIDQSVGNSFIAVSYGGVSSTTQNLAVAAQTMRGAGALDIYLVGTGATNSQKLTSTLVVSATSTAPSEGGWSASKNAAVDSTVPQVITVEVRHDTSSNACFFEPDLVVGELIK